MRRCSFVPPSGAARRQSSHRREQYWYLSVVGLLTALVNLFSFSLAAQEDAAPSEAETPPATIQLRDGSRIKGEVVDMQDGELKVKTGFGGDIPVSWEEITELLSKLRLRLVLTDESILEGTVEPGDGTNLRVITEDSVEPILVPFTAVSAINPPPPSIKKFVKGNVNVGINVADGNSQTKAANANAEFVLRYGDHRGTLRGIWNYAEDSGKTSARNARGSLKYDYFVTERLYLYASGMLEGDSFQNLELRRVLSAGLGYQFVENGDFESEYFKKLEAYGELGASYFHEDFQDTTTAEFVSGRWSADVKWEFLPDRVTFFHHHEGYPNFDRFADLLLITEQGLRFSLYSGLTASLQINWRWDNVPASGTERSDTLYLFSLGYEFDAEL